MLKKLSQRSGLMSKKIRFTKSFKKRGSTTKVCIHCSDTKINESYSVEQCHKDHLRRNWIGIGYHYYVTKAGIIHNGRDHWAVGAGEQSLNSEAIHICMEGGKSPEGVHTDSAFTAKTIRSTRELIESLQKMYGNLQVVGHYEYDKNKKCPVISVEYFRDASKMKSFPAGVREKW